MGVGGLRFRQGSPVALANLAGDFGDAFAGQAPHRAQEFRDHGGTFADDFEQIAGNPPGQREQRVNPRGGSFREDELQGAIAQTAAGLEMAAVRGDECGLG